MTNDEFAKLESDEEPNQGCKINAFHAHLDQCEQCRNNPFGLCETGAKLLLGVAAQPN